MSIQLTKNFRSDEFRCRCGCNHTYMDVGFMVLLQRVRDIYGKQMTVTSGWRCQNWNSKVGGAPNSYHLTGRAADIAIDYHDERYLLVKAAQEVGLKGIGIGKSWIHLDNRSVPTMFLY